MNRLGLLILLAVLVVYGAALYASYELGLSKTLGINDYISDECWYISSGINVARKVLGLQIVPKINSSYAEYTIVYNASCGIDGALDEVIEHAPLALIDKVDYDKIDAFTVIVPLNETSGMDELARLASQGNTSCVRDVFPGILPDADNVNTYLNTEHPPLVKYIVGILAWRYGFRFGVFRVASFIMEALGLLSVVLIAYRAIAVWRKAALVALVVPVFLVFMDKSVQSMSAVAMLDIYVASLDALAAALIAFNHGLSAAVVIGLAASAKYTGIFPLPGLLLYEKLRGGSAKKVLAELVIPVVVVAAFWAPFALKYGLSWVINEVIGALQWHTTSRPSGGPPSTNPLGLLLGRDVFVLYYMDSKPFLEAAAHPAVTLPALVLSLFGLPGLLIAACRARLPKWGAWAAGIATMYLSAIGGYVVVYLAGNHTLYSFYGIQLSLLAGTVLASYYAYMVAADELSREPIRECACSPVARSWLPVLLVTVGLSLGLWLYGLYPLSPLIPGIEPISTYVYSTLNSKVAKILVIGATWLLYSAIAYRIKGPSPCTWRKLGAQIVTWVPIGMVSVALPAALFAPIAALLTIVAEPGIIDGLVSGLLLPLPGIGLGGRNKGFTLGFLAGYVAALLLVIKPSYIGNHVVIIVATGAAGLLIALLRDTYTRLGLVSISSPSLVVATASLITVSEKASLVILPPLGIVAAAAYTENKLLALAAPLAFLGLYHLFRTRPVTPEKSPKGLGEAVAERNNNELSDEEDGEALV